MNEKNALAEALRDALLDTLVEAHEDAGIRGLCGEGRFEAAVEAVRRVDLTALVLERAAADALAEALSEKHALHLPGARPIYRERLERALSLTGDALERGDLDASTLAGARLTRVVALAAHAQDARHGAGQLSQSAQRAPTAEDCEQGWEQVEAIVARCEASARETAQLASLLDVPRADDAARAAWTAAEDARRIVQQRNHAYTFHADPEFSFGEGWYVAAAGVLANVDIQIEPAQLHTPQVERFSSDIGVVTQPYRPRPRANKALPALIARAFTEDPGAQNRLRAAFLGDGEIPAAITDWADGALAGTPRTKSTILVWVRSGAHHPNRNSTVAELQELCRLAARNALVPILIGDAASVEGAIDMTLFWRLPLFQGADMRRAQLQLFEHLRRAHGLVGQVGVTTAGMDGPALMGLPTMYLTDDPNPRLGRWVGAVPGYEEVIRDSDYLERVGRTFSRWGERR